MLSFPYMLYLSNAPLIYLLVRYLIFILDYHLAFLCSESAFFSLLREDKFLWRNLVSPGSHA